MAKILIVDDDIPLCGVIESWLKFEQNVVECVHTAQEAIDLLKLYHYDVVVLDWKLPDLSGVDVLREYRSFGVKTPVILLTGKRQIEEKELGLDAGADDYLTKPFEMRELSARLRALLRRPPDVLNNLMQVKDLVLDVKTRTVSRAGSEIKLFPKEFSLLECLMRNQNQVLSQEELVNHLWKSEEGVAPDALRTCLKRLRKQIDKEGEPSLIENVHGVGYILKG